jgi:hypothetical protein
LGRRAEGTEGRGLDQRGDTETRGF